jgi:hypothetical protein
MGVLIEAAQHPTVFQAIAFLQREPSGASAIAVHVSPLQVPCFRVPQSSIGTSFVFCQQQVPVLPQSYCMESCSHAEQIEPVVTQL